MLATMSYETAQHLDNIQSGHLMTIFYILIGIFAFGCVISFFEDFESFGLTTAVLTIIAIVVWGVYAQAITPRVVVVAKRELPGLQQQVETLKTQRLEAIHKNKSSKDIKQITKEIANKQSTITKYNNLIIKNDND